MIRGLGKLALRKFGFEIHRPRSLPYAEACVSVSPQGNHRGRCLMAYILEPFLDKSRDVNTSHTHFLESLLMAEAWTRLGYAVDVIDYRHWRFQPERHYDFCVSARRHLADFAPRLNADCVKIVHLDTAHFTTNNRATYDRLRSFQARKGVTIPESMRVLEHNFGIDAADYGVLLGNAATQATYEYAGKPLFQLDVPAAVSFDWDGTKNFEECRTRFLWLGSSGLLHKGLDLSIEAFLEMPGCELTICGPTDTERRLIQAYERELKDCRNVHVHGWVDVASQTFRDIVNRCGSVVYPSCGEGQAGAVVTCMRAGLVPLVSPETGLDVQGFGELIAEGSVEAVKRTVQSVAALPSHELEARARRTWETGVNRHSGDAYLDRYTEILSQIIGDCSASQ